MSAATVFTVLTFKQEVPPMRVAEVRLSSVRVGGKEVPIADVGLFKSDKLLSKCNGLHVEQIEVEIVAPDCSPGVYRQLTGGGLPVEEFHEKQLANGLRLNACFPEHIKFFVTNRTDSPREFWMEMDGIVARLESPWCGSTETIDYRRMPRLCESARAGGEVRLRHRR